MNKGFSIAIDGPVASGKGTLAETLANKLGGFSINTGAMYRAVALFCLSKNINLEKEEDVISVLPNINIELKDNVYLNGNDVTERLKEPNVASASAVVAYYSGVRKDLAERQRKIALQGISEEKVIIAEGRDIGTRVLPDADIKIFLTASPEIRAKRRLGQYIEKGINKKFEDVLEETKIRDELDTTRETDPLPTNPESLGYFVLNDSNQTEEETVQSIIEELRRRGLIK